MPNCDPLIQIFFFFSRNVIKPSLRNDIQNIKKRKDFFLSKTFLLIIPKIQGRRARISTDNWHEISTLKLHFYS